MMMTMPLIEWAILMLVTPALAVGITLSATFDRERFKEKQARKRRLRVAVKSAVIAEQKRESAVRDLIAAYDAKHAVS